MAAVTVVNGGDNIGVYTPVFATRTPAEVAAMIAAFVPMLGVWLAVSGLSVRCSALGAPIRRIGTTAMPFVLIGIGTLVLHESGALAAIARFCTDTALALRLGRSF